jgi:hypothetical protein
MAVATIASIGVTFGGVAAQERTSVPKNMLALGVAAYDSVRLGVEIPFALGEDFCRSHHAPFAVDFEITDSAGTVLAVPTLIADNSGGLVKPKALRGLPLGCGAFSAFWADSARALLRQRGAVFGFKIFVDGAPLISRKAPLKY